MDISSNSMLGCSCKREGLHRIMQLQLAIEQYLFSRSKRLSEKTILTYKRNLGKFAEYVGRETELTEISDFLVDTFQVSLKEHLKESTQCNYAHTLRSFFKYWKAKGETQLAYELVEGPRIPENIPNHITPERFDIIDDYLDESSYDTLSKRVIFNLLWNTGMRIGELLSLNISDIHIQQNYATIITEKSKKVRLVKWNDACHKLLVKYLGVRICLNERPELFQTPRSTTGKKTRLTARTVQRWCAAMSQELGFPINPHAFRHGKMHYILSQGGRRHDIKEIAGHSSITSSEVYTRLNITEQSKLLDQFLPKTEDFEMKKFYAQAKKHLNN